MTEPIRNSYGMWEVVCSDCRYTFIAQTFFKAERLYQNHPCSLYQMEREVHRQRPWQERCGETGRWPVRCRRDLGHDSPHVGYGQHRFDLVTWPVRRHDMES